MPWYAGLFVVSAITAGMVGLTVFLPITLMRFWYQALVDEVEED